MSWEIELRLTNHRKGDARMGGNESDMRQKADARLKEARSNGSSAEQISQLQTARDIVRDTELSKTGGNRQAGER